MEQKRENGSAQSNEARNAYVVEQITQTVIRLLHKKPLTEMSISEICSAAAVGRTSFYRNYETKEDVIRRYIEKTIGAWKSDFEALGETSNAKMYGSLFQHLKDHADFYLLLERRGLMHLFLQVFMTLFGPTPEDENMWAYTKAFISYGTYGWIEEWIARGMQESAGTMAELLASHGMQ